jgi:DMSO reductase anchor subunit
MRRQTVWGWLALGNFFLGGSGSALFVAAFVLTQLGAGGDSFTLYQSTFVATALVILGLVCVGLEAGKKTRAMNVFFNLKKSWMSREAFFATAFVLAGFLDLLLQNFLFQILAFLFASGLVVSQGYILMAARAIPAWRTRLIPPLLWFSSMVAGVGLFLMVSLLTDTSKITSFTDYGIAIASLSLILTSACYATSIALNSGSRKALEVDRNRELLAVSIILTGAVPLLISFLMMSVHIEQLFLLAGLLMIGGSALTKYLVLIRFSYVRPVIDLGTSAYIFREST